MARSDKRRNPGLFGGFIGSRTLGPGNGYGYGLFHTPNTPQCPEDVEAGHGIQPVRDFGGAAIRVTLP